MQDRLSNHPRLAARVAPWLALPAVCVVRWDARCQPGVPSVLGAAYATCASAAGAVAFAAVRSVAFATAALLWFTVAQ